jgi:tRNA wybutosine-synthesizing protein 1
VPWHVEVRSFCEALAAKLGGVAGCGYGLAVEHSHSCFVLLAKNAFLRNGAWHTHIDYERFHELVSRFYATGARFTTMDYLARTPDWATYGSPEAGFDPLETRFRRHGTTHEEIGYKASSSGCG